jgi:hypothetical protein
MSDSYSHNLGSLPKGATAHSVTASPCEVGGRSALRVELTDAITLRGVAGVDYVDMPTLVQLPVPMRSGVIEVDVRSQLNGKTEFDSRAFAGVAYRIADDLSSFEAVYLRPLNGSALEPAPPRNRRAVQYFAYPDWKFDRLREEYPDGRYESGADIRPAEWIHLRIDVEEQSVLVRVDDILVLTVDEPKSTPRVGGIGLFVDIGSVAEFADLRVSRRT